MASIKVEFIDGVERIYLSGFFLGNEETDALSETLEKSFKNKRKNIELNFSSNTYLNSISLGVLISFNSRIHKIKGEIKIINRSQEIQNLIQLTKLDKIFNIVFIDTKLEH